MESGHTDSKVHFSGDNEPTLSQSALSLAINSLVKVVTCSGVCVQIAGAWGGVKLDIAGSSSFFREKMGAIVASDRIP